MFCKTHFLSSEHFIHIISLVSTFVGFICPLLNHYPDFSKFKQTNKRKSEKISWNSLFLPKYVVGCKITNFKSIKQNYHITQSSSKMPVNAFSQNISNSYSSCTNLVITSVQQHNLMSYENSYKYKF